MNKRIEEFKNKHNKLLKVSGGIMIAAIGFSLGRKFEDQSIINSLKYLSRNGQMRYMEVDGEKYILSMIKETDLKNKFESLT